MTTEQLVLIIVVPIIVSILANLLTDPVKRLIAGASSSVRRRYERREADRQELVDALVARDGLATQYLVIMWGGTLALWILAVVFIALGTLYDSVLGGTAPNLNVFIINGTLATYGALRAHRKFSRDYREYLKKSDVPEPLIRALLGSLGRSKGTA